MSLMDATDAALDELILARAALVRMRDQVHDFAQGEGECDDRCADYHAAMRAVTRAAEAIGMGVVELDTIARAVNREQFGVWEAQA